MDNLKPGDQKINKSNWDKSGIEKIKKIKDINISKLLKKK